MREWGQTDAGGESPDEETPDDQCLAGGRVLIVDDEEGIRALFQTIVANDLPGVRLDMARDGAEALLRFQQCPYQVLIMDLHMPVMDGLAAFERIQHHCQMTETTMPAVIFCTGFAPPRGVREIVNGSTRHVLLAKPVRGEVLVSAIRSHL